MSELGTDKTLERMAEYFQLHAGSWWKWGDDGRVIEFANGSTVCYREELQAILAHQAPFGLPHLSQVLAVMAACKDNFLATPFTQYSPEQDANSTGVEGHKVDGALVAFLKLVHALPKVHRVEPGIYHLFQTLFGNDPVDEGIEPNEELVATFKSGRLDPYLASWPIDLYGAEARELEAMRPIAERFPTQESLENALCSGMTAPPSPAPITLPDLQRPDDEATTFLDLLLEDRRTAGLANLARHIVAALNIPLRSRGSNDLPLGGVSDITNRGNYDRLLLSELAADDITLMARLANNEALFLRREQPPIKVEKERIVLMDTTIKLWGLPRTFAVAAALACGERNLPGNGLRAFALGGARFVDADIQSVEGVVQLLGRLDASLHAATGLEACLKTLPKHHKEVIFVTAQEVLDDLTFAARLMPLQTELDYIVAVTRDGRLRLIEVHNGHRKLLSEAAFDLPQLLQKLPSFKPKPQEITDANLPAFVQQFPAPLYFPATSIRLRPNNSKAFSLQCILVVTENRRALLWQGQEFGAMELFPQIIPSRSMDLEYFEGRYFVLLIGHSDPCKYTLYVYDIQLDERWQAELEPLVYWKGVFFKAGQVFYLRSGEKSGTHDCFRYDCATGVEEKFLFDVATLKGNRIGNNAHNIRHGLLKHIINPGYSTLQQVKYLRLHANCELNIEGRSLIINEKGAIEFVYRGQHGAVHDSWVRAEDAFAGLKMPGNDDLRLRRARWKDGSLAFVDPRGFLHLKSSDPKLPEVTIVMVIDTPTALWASNGHCAGNAYFIGDDNPKHVTATYFFDRYLNPLLQTILNKL